MDINKDHNDLQYIFNKARVCSLHHRDGTSDRRGFCSGCLADLRNTRMLRETPTSIYHWLKATFGHGPDTNNNREARFREEVAELLVSLHAIQNAPDTVAGYPAQVAAVEEAADVYLTLTALCVEALNCDLHKEVDAKMARNRASEWLPNKSGRIMRKGKEDKDDRISPPPTVIVAQHADDFAITKQEMRAVLRQTFRHYITQEDGTSGPDLHKLLDRIRRHLTAEEFAAFLQDA